MRNKAVGRADQLTPDEIREVKRMAANSARDGGLGLVILPNDLKVLSKKDGRGLDTILASVVMSFCGIADAGGDIADKDRATFRHMVAAQDLYARAWIAERKRRNLSLVNAINGARAKVLTAGRKS